MTLRQTNIQPRITDMYINSFRLCASQDSHTQRRCTEISFDLSMLLTKKNLNLRYNARTRHAL